MNNTILETITKKFIENPHSMNVGSSKLAKRNNTSREVILEAKRLARQELNKNNVTQIVSIVKDCLGVTETETDHQTGNQKFIVNSDKPLSPKEIEEMVGVDNITTFVDRSWLKSHRDGTWTYSVLTVCKVKNFYNTEELQNKIFDIFKKTGILPLESTPGVISDKALFIYIADDHAGLVLKDSLYNREYSQGTYTNRLLQIANEVKNLKETFSEMYIVRLGDEMDGYNGKTTRYDHDLESLSNKEQFDMYTVSNKIFYDEIFTSGKANNYNLISLSNSNHTGKGFSYIANKALEFWLEAKYPFVKVSQQERFIDTIRFGNHVIGLVHGKDEKYMKAPMPLNLDFKTDLWLMEYYKKYILEGSFVSTIKADIHKFNINQGKSGRYVNVPSISSGSAWIEHNFGDSESGALLEIYTADSKNIQTMPIWFY